MTDPESPPRDPLPTWEGSPHYVQTYLQRFVPIVAAVALIVVLWSSEVPPDLIVLSGAGAEVVLWLYVLTLVGLSIFPDWIRLHLLGGVLSCLTVSARGMGFTLLVINEGRTDLAGAVAERVLILVLLLGWHTAMSSRIGLGQSAAPVRSLARARGVIGRTGDGS